MQIYLPEITFPGRCLVALLALQIQQKGAYTKCKIQICMIQPCNNFKYRSTWLSHKKAILVYFKTIITKVP